MFHTRNRHGFITILLVFTVFLVMTQCFAQNSEVQAVTALINGYLIDGTGGKPLENAVVIIRDGKIASVEKGGREKVPDGAKIIDVQGGTIMPGFINAHVHHAYNAENLKAWANGGVTTVRDESLPGNPAETLKLRDTVLHRSEYARIISSGPMMTKPNGYGQLYIDSPEEAKRRINELADAGVDAIKVSLEDGYAGQHNLPKLTEEEIKVIIEEAHRRGLPVSCHTTQARYQEVMVRLGVDDIAHIAYDFASDELLETMVSKHIYWIPTFTVFRNFGASLDDAVANLKSFVTMGGQVALGNDFGGGPGEFELGIPMYEITMMRRAGMTPMQIILASTRNAAMVCHREKILGTLEAGKIADILVVDGNPLHDINALKNVRLVMKDGVVIRKG